MLVVHRIELRVLDQPHEVRKLERYRSARLQRVSETAGEVVYVRHVREDVVADDEIGATALLGASFAQRLSEELPQHRYSQRLGGGCGTVRRLDAEARNSGFHEVPEQVTVVRRDLDDEAFRVELQPPGDV